MIYTYEELTKLKEKGEMLTWENISKAQLASLFFAENISDYLIADLYNIKKNQVTYKRKKLDITRNSPEYYDRIYQKIMKDIPELNTQAKEFLCKKENISIIAKAITHYIFRNGPVEDMHTQGKFSQQDMKILNKYMVNRIAGLLELAINGDWIKLQLMVEFLMNYGMEWDKVECDTQEIDNYFYWACKRKVEPQTTRSNL